MKMTMKKPATGWKLQRVTTRPGEMLREEFLLPLGITQNALAMKIRVPATRIGDIVHGRRPTQRCAWRSSSATARSSGLTFSRCTICQRPGLN